jgi:hypothetical protein
MGGSWISYRSRIQDPVALLWIPYIVPMSHLRHLYSSHQDKDSISTLNSLDRFEYFNRRFLLRRPHACLSHQVNYCFKREAIFSYYSCSELTKPGRHLQQKLSKH